MLRQQEPDMISYPEIEIQMDIGFLLVASFHPSMCCISVVYFSLDSHAGNVQWSMLNCIDWKGKRKTIVWAQFTGSTRTSAWASDMYYMEKYVCLGVGCRINFVHTQGTYIQYRRCSFPGSPPSCGARQRTVAFYVLREMQFKVRGAHRDVLHLCSSL